MQSASDRRTVFLKDYRPPDYRIDTADLHFDLDEFRTRVHSRLAMAADCERSGAPLPLVLQGRRLKLLSLKIDGRPLAGRDYRLDGESLTLQPPAARFLLEVETECNPSANTDLTGLYRSGGMLCTQCEAEGFRRITFYPDRPDVLARFTTTLEAERAKYPVLLSNGNLVDSGTLAQGRHFATWHDPFPKPAYLFALVAGDLARREEEFLTRSGRKVALRLYVQPHNRDRCEHALACLKQAMAWDEAAYGREYDLDLYMIVATDDFNAGAMENKGLNLFNSRYVLAKPQTATDADFDDIREVVAHEYLHNWSGNRVTCRDWFQLSLKEGFTIFRNQQFMEETASRGVVRIRDVNFLRTRQFTEDGGPMAHPVRPEAYQEINNFYTATVYNKGAELIRMCRTLLGAPGFRRGTDLYFSRHDGRAATIDDFVKALEDANGADLTQFKRWYAQAGTPELHITRSLDPAARTCEWSIRQTCTPTPGQPRKAPLHIPVAVGFVDRNGRDAPSQLLGERHAQAGTRVLQLRNAEERFLFVNVPDGVVPSVLRGFSAPVRIHIDLTDAERLFLMANDSDEFNRWDSGQQVATQQILALVEAQQRGAPLGLAGAFVDAFGRTLETAAGDKAFQSLLLTLPADRYLAQFMAVIDPDALDEAKGFVRRTVAAAFTDTLWSLYLANHDPGSEQRDRASMGRRSLKNTCLRYLAELADRQTLETCVRQFRAGGNMTDVAAALSCLADREGAERGEALAAFHDRWQADPLVLDKWFAVQAASRLPDTLQRVRALTGHPAFSLANPNRVLALVGTFADNQRRFHEAGGAGYRFLADTILTLDPLNPQIAARLASAFTMWRRFDEHRQVLMRGELERMLGAPGLSTDVHEIASKTLA